MVSPAGSAGFKCSGLTLSTEVLPFLRNPKIEATYTYSDSEAETSTRPDETILVPERSRHLACGYLRLELDAMDLPDESMSYQSRSLDDVGDVAARDGYREAVIGMG